MVIIIIKSTHVKHTILLCSCKILNETFISNVFQPLNKKPLTSVLKFLAILLWPRASIPP